MSGLKIAVLGKRREIEDTDTPDPLAYPQRNILHGQRELTRAEFASDSDDTSSSSDDDDDDDDDEDEDADEDHKDSDRQGNKQGKTQPDEGSGDAENQQPSTPETQIEKPTPSEGHLNPNQHEHTGSQRRHSINSIPLSTSHRFSRPSLGLDTDLHSSSPPLSPGTISSSSLFAGPAINFRDSKVDRISLEIDLKVLLLPCLPRLRAATCSADLLALKTCVDEALAFAEIHEVSAPLLAKCYFYVGLVNFVLDLHEKKDELESMKIALATFDKVRGARDHSIEALWVQEWQIHLQDACRKLVQEAERPPSSYSLSSAVSGVSSWIWGNPKPSTTSQHPSLLLRAGRHIGIWEIPLTPPLGRNGSRPATGDSLNRVPSFASWSTEHQSYDTNSRPNSAIFSSRPSTRGGEEGRGDRYAPEGLRQPPLPPRKTTSNESLRAKLLGNRSSLDGARLLRTPEKQQRSITVTESSSPVGRKLFSTVAGKDWPSPIDISPGSDVSPSNQQARSTAISFDSNARPPLNRGLTDSGDEDGLYACRRRKSSSFGLRLALGKSVVKDEVELAEEGASPVRVDFGKGGV